MTALTTGIATAFASGPTSDTCENSSKAIGARPTVMDHCTRAHCTSHDSRPVQPCVT